MVNSGENGSMDVLYQPISQLLFNGKLRAFFKASIRLKQGDPLSALLFSMVVDVLGMIVDRACEGFI